MNIQKYYSRKINYFLFACAVLMFYPGFAEQYVFGGKNGWDGVDFRRGITEGTGRFGYKCLELATNGAVSGEDTDLLIDFEDADFTDTAGNYIVSENSLFISKDSIMGKGAAASGNTGGGLVLTGKNSGMFGKDGPAGSFMMDFWLCPSIVENGEVILNWRSSRDINGFVVYQLINVSFRQNKVEWLFSNLFDGYTRDGGDVMLLSYRSLIPGKWSHHLLSFNEESGCLEYRIDGQLEAVKFITSTGRELGSVYPVMLGVPAEIQLCPSYTGLIDDFHILKRAFEEGTDGNAETAGALKKSVYSVAGGRFESEPILTSAGSVINSVTAEMYVPAQTDVSLYVRGGDNYFNWTEDYPEWKAVRSGEKIEDVNGTYFQIAADLLPDGAGSKTPSVTEITVDYSEIPEPLPPFTVAAEKGDGCVTLSWSHSVDDTAGGYYVYYGIRPGEYLGRMAAEGPSPVNVGSSTVCKITGLKNGTIYYFAVAAWSKMDSRICGPLSKEVYARPSLK